MTDPIYLRGKGKLLPSIASIVALVDALSPARWHDKHTYLSSLGMLGTSQFNFFADHVIFKNGYMKYAHTRQRMTTIKEKQV